MNWISRRISLFLISLCLLLGVFALPAHAQITREAKMYVVTIWNAGCPGSTRHYWDDMVDAWYDEITDATKHAAAYTRDGRQVNGNIVNSQFADVNQVAWGNDTNHLDEGDAVMLGWHGGEDGNVYVGSMRVNEAGGGDCNLRRDEMEIGDSDLEFMHLSSCHSMDQNQWSEWWRAFGGAHQVDGFHGWMWIGPGLVDDYQDFADDAFSTSIADAWLDNMYVPNISGSDDQCPVAYAVGSSSSDVENRMNNERYNNVFSDPPVNWWRVVYIRGCDPAGEGPLPL